MGYQAPPTLPDYSKLTFLLNSSGVQQWNPAVYDILKNLIEAVQQSQQTFIQNTIIETVNKNINSIVTTINNNHSVTVLADNPLIGDGSLSSHLQLNIDSNTMQLTALGNLQAGLIARTVNFAANIPTGTTVSGVIPALTGYVAYPLFAIAEVKYLGYTTGRNISLRYNGNTTDIILFPNIISGGGVPANRWLYDFPSSTFFDVAVGRIDNKAIDIVFTGNNSAFTAGDSLIVTIYYIYLKNNLP